MPKKSNKVRADGRIAVQVYLGLVDGKRKYKTVYGSTQKEASAKAEELKLMLGKGIDIASENDSFSLWAERWLNQKKFDVGNAQYESYKQTLAKLNTYIGNFGVAQIKSCDIQRIINDYAIENPHTGEPSSKRLLNLILNTAKQIFKFLMINRVIEYNPTDGVTVPKKAPVTHRRALTEQERQWINTTEHRMQTFAMIMMYAGLRRGEVIPLKWSDVDLKKGTITVNKAVEFISRKPVIKDTKTQAGNRIVYIPNNLIAYLKSINKSNILVCPSMSGDMHTKDSFRSGWNSYLTELDIKCGDSDRRSKYDPRYKGIQIEKITPHMLRHTFCTMMYENGVDVLTAKKQMGHSDIKTTLEIYTHLSEEHTAEEMQKMNKCKSNASQNLIISP